MEQQDVVGGRGHRRAASAAANDRAYPIGVSLRITRVSAEGAHEELVRVVVVASSIARTPKAAVRLRWRARAEHSRSAGSAAADDEDGEDRRVGAGALAGCEEGVDALMRRRGLARRRA